MKRFLVRPHQTALRRIMVRIHLWAGLGLGIYLAVIGVTGAVLLFKDDGFALVHPRSVPCCDCRRADRQHRHDRRISKIEISRASDPAHRCTYPRDAIPI